MLLKNGKEYFGYTCIFRELPSSSEESVTRAIWVFNTGGRSVAVDLPLAVPDYNTLQGVINETMYYDTDSSWFSGDATKAGCFMVFGTGTTAAKPDDYALEKPIKSGLICLSSTNIPPNSDVFWGISSNIQNTNNESITVNEVGVVVRSLGYRQTSALYDTLLIRNVLSEPITFNPYEMKNITVTI